MTPANLKRSQSQSILPFNLPAAAPTHSQGKGEATWASRATLRPEGHTSGPINEDTRVKKRVMTEAMKLAKRNADRDKWRDIKTTVLQPSINIRKFIIHVEAIAVTQDEDRCIDVCKGWKTKKTG